MHDRPRSITDPRPGKRKLINMALENVPDLKLDEEVIDVWEVGLMCWVHRDEKCTDGSSGMWAADYLMATNRRFIIIRSDKKLNTYSRGAGNKPGIHESWVFKNKASIPYDDIWNAHIPQDRDEDILRFNAKHMDIYVVIPRSIQRDGTLGRAEAKDIGKLIPSGLQTS